MEYYLIGLQVGMGFVTICIFSLICLNLVEGFVRRKKAKRLMEILEKIQNGNEANEGKDAKTYGYDKILKMKEDKE